MKNKIMACCAVMAVILCSACGSKTASATISLSGDEAQNNTGAVDSNDEISDDTASAKGNENEEKENLTDYEKLFEEGLLLAFDENGMAGYININGEYVIAPQFGDGKDFSEGYAAVMDLNTMKWGFIDTSGNYVVDPIYVSVYDFYQGTAIVQPEYFVSGMINTDGDYIIEPVYQDVSYYKDGYALVTYKDESTSETIYHFIDEAGNFVFDDYSDAYLFHKGLAAVKLVGSSYYYMLKDNGDSMVFEESPVAFHSSRSYGTYSNVNRYMDLTDDETVGYTDWNAEYLISNQGETISDFYDDIGVFSLDFCVVGMKDYEVGATLYGYMDRDYNWVIDPVYKECGNFCCDYTWAVEWLDYDQSAELVNSGDIFACWYIIDKQGNRVMDGSQLKHNGIGINIASMNASDMLGLPIPATNYNTQTSGYVNQNYEEVIPFIYEYVGGFSRDGSYAFAKYNGLWGIIDINGSWLIEPKFNRLSTVIR